jgi:hypothetical protein
VGSGAVYLTYEVLGISKTQMENLNLTDNEGQSGDKINGIYMSGGYLSFLKVENDELYYKMLLVDSKMGYILSQMLLYFHINGKADFNNILDYIESYNPCNFPRRGIYTYKFKEFLYEYLHDADILKEADESLLNPYNRSKLEQYLLENSYFKSNLSSRQQYTQIYCEDDKMYAKLNFEIQLGMI